MANQQFATLIRSRLVQLSLIYCRIYNHNSVGATVDRLIITNNDHLRDLPYPDQGFLWIWLTQIHLPPESASLSHKVGRGTTTGRNLPVYPPIFPPDVIFVLIYLFRGFCGLCWRFRKFLPYILPILFFGERKYKSRGMIIPSGRTKHFSPDIYPYDADISKAL